MPKKYISWLVLLLFVCIAFGCGSEPLKRRLLKDSVAVDKAYIPALVYAETFNQKEAAVAIDILKQKWEEFYGKYYTVEIKYGVDIVDRFWKTNFDDIQMAIISAEAFIKINNLPLAYVRLATVRSIMGDLRHRHGIYSFLDALTEFNDALQKAFFFLRGKRQLNHRDITILNKHLSRIQEDWDVIEKIQFDASLYKFRSSKNKAIRQRVAEMGEKVKSLSDDNALPVILSLRDDFMLLYKAFGDFDTVNRKIKAMSPPTTTTTLAPKPKKKVRPHR